MCAHARTNVREERPRPAHRARGHTEGTPEDKVFERARGPRLKEKTDTRPVDAIFRCGRRPCTPHHELLQRHVARAQRLQSTVAEEAVRHFERAQRTTVRCGAFDQRVREVGAAAHV